MTTIDLRKRPKQARSLLRFNSILDEAESMIGEQRNTELKMNELARRADVNIASIYQYFPNRAALLRQLIERYLERYQLVMRESLSSYSGEPLGLVDLIVDGYQAFFTQSPVFAALWAEAQGDTELKQLDIKDSLHNAQFIAQIAVPYFPSVEKKSMQSLCFMFCDLSGSLMQTVLSMPDKKQGAVLVKAYKAMMKAYLETLL